MKTLLLLPAIILLVNTGSTQHNATYPASDMDFLTKMEDTLSILSYAVINDSIPEERFAICHKLIKSLVTTLKTENSFAYPFKKLESVSIQYPADSSFRIFTWQLYVSENEYRYFGAIQMNEPQLKLFPLIDRSFNVQDIEQEELTADKWYGAVYYKLKEVAGPAGNYYLLFGFDGFEFFRKRKVVDVLTFKDGKPNFGAPVFVKPIPGGQETKNRLYLEYSATASVKMNFDEAYEKLIYDHLIVMEGPHGEGPVNIPDGSYEAYVLQNGLWIYEPFAFRDSQEEAPRPVPVLENAEGKNIFGKKKGN